MCRLFGFRSSILSGVHSSLVAAENALAHQSREHPDGWGVAYYHGAYPHVLRSEKQALADGLFKEMSGVVSTRTLLAHVRQATTGKVSVLNCHPFQFGPWTFAHNGQLSGFDRDTHPEVVRALATRVDPRFRNHILGNTDSEVCFYLFLSHLARKVEDVLHEGVRVALVRDALEEMVDVILETCPDALCDEGNRLTFMVTNGNVLFALKYRKPLYFSTYKTKCPERTTCFAYEPSRCEREVTDGIVKHLVVGSERIAEGPNVWSDLADGEYVCVDHGMNFNRGNFAALSDNKVTRLPVVR